MDRIDIQIDVPAISAEELQWHSTSEPSDDIRMRVEAARNRMLVRQGKLNSLLGPRDVEQHCVLNANSIYTLQRAISKLGLSARSYHRTLKVARSIADLAGAEAIVTGHVAEALGYRRKLDDRSDGRST